jgi:lysine-specific demethylase 3
VSLQVANMADCIKAAIDFVSPENITRCERLTTEFQEQNESRVWKEDVLQLRTMMWFAWQSCCQQESALSEDN